MAPISNACAMQVHMPGICGRPPSAMLTKLVSILLTSTEYVAAREADGREAQEPPHVAAFRERVARARKQGRTP